MKMRTIMKTKSLIILLFLLTSSSVFAQSIVSGNSLTAFLETNPKCRMGINLVFKNHTDHYILLPTTFDNLTWGAERTGHSGIKMQFYYNGQPFRLDIGRPPLWSRPFGFYWGSVEIAPRSEVRLPFHIRERNFSLYSKCVIERLEVSFSMNYLFFVLIGDENNPSPMGGVFLVTNRVNIVTPVVDVEQVECYIITERYYRGVCLVCGGVKL